MEAATEERKEGHGCEIQHSPSVASQVLSNWGGRTEQASTDTQPTTCNSIHSEYIPPRPSIRSTIHEPLAGAQCDIIHSHPRGDMLSPARYCIQWGCLVDVAGKVSAALCWCTNYSYSLAAAISAMTSSYQLAMFMELVAVVSAPSSNVLTIVKLTIVNTNEETTASATW